MKLLSILGLLVLLLNCNTQWTKTYKNDIIQLRTSNPLIIKKFDSCLLITQSLIRREITEAEFYKYFRFNKRETGLLYKYNVHQISDSLKDIPEGYSIFYDFIYKGDTISSFNADFDSSLNLTFYRFYHLIAFRKFLDKELTIAKNEAMQIAMAKGINGKGIQPIFNTSKYYPDTLNRKSVQYYWTVSGDCDGCKIINIDAKTGEVIQKGEVKIIH